MFLQDNLWEEESLWYSTRIRNQPWNCPSPVYSFIWLHLGSRQGWLDSPCRGFFSRQQLWPPVPEEEQENPRWRVDTSKNERTDKKETYKEKKNHITIQHPQYCRTSYSKCCPVLVLTYHAWPNKTVHICISLPSLLSLAALTLPALLCSASWPPSLRLSPAWSTTELGCIFTLYLSW